MGPKGRLARWLLIGAAIALFAGIACWRVLALRDPIVGVWKGESGYLKVEPSGTGSWKTGDSDPLTKNMLGTFRWDGRSHTWSEGFFKGRYEILGDDRKTLVLYTRDDVIWESLERL
jgi:hypothetical protein